MGVKNFSFCILRTRL